MKSHQFGGSWTDTKLEILRQYLIPYRQIFTTSAKAKHFKTIYIDAFAGTGERVDPNLSPDVADLIGDTDPSERDAYKKGSARIALEVTPPFDRYVFVEKQPERSAELRVMVRSEFPNLVPRCNIVQGDANGYLQENLPRVDWDNWRAVLFLDPYGMAVEWETIKIIAETRAIDLWVLFPVGQGVNRLLTRASTPPPEWEARLTRMFGTEEWKARFYAPSRQQDIFGDTPGMLKDTSFDLIGEYFLERLRATFAGVAPHAAKLENSRNVPLYWLCFAAGNPRGAGIAVKIANHLLGQQARQRRKK
ncbi:MAG: three-Cys-motif partner protein TcmP [Gammaproteobacteria bacterium]